MTPNGPLVPVTTPCRSVAEGRGEVVGIDCLDGGGIGEIAEGHQHRARGAVLQMPDIAKGGREIDRPGHVQHVGEPAEELVSVERSEEHTSELQSLMRISYAVFCLKHKKYRQDKIQ